MNFEQTKVESFNRGNLSLFTFEDNETAFVISDDGTVDEFRGYLNIYLEDSLKENFKYTLLDNIQSYSLIFIGAGIEFRTSFLPLDEAINALAQMILNSIQDSKIYIQEGYLTVIAANERGDTAFGHSNPYLRGFSKYIVFSKNSQKYCIYIAFYHWLLMFKSNWKEEVILNTKKLADQTRDFIRNLYGKNNLKEVEFTVQEALPKIQNYMIRKSKTPMNLKFIVHNDQFEEEWTLDYKEDCLLDKQLVHLRLNGAHCELLIPRVQWKDRPELLEKVEESFKTLAVFRDLGENGKIYRCIDQRDHYLYQPQGSTEFSKEYTSVEQMETLLLRCGVNPMVGSSGEYRLILSPKEKEKLREMKYKGKNNKKPKEKYKRNFVAFDIETYPDPKSGEENAFMIGLCWKKDNLFLYKSFEDEDCIKEFFKYIHEHYDTFANAVFYAHNGGKFDNFVLLREYLLYNTDKFQLTNKKFIVVNNAVISFDASYKGKDKAIISFKDSFRVMPASLKQLTKDFNVEHKKLDFDIGNNRNEWKKYRDEINKYLEHDCKGLWEVCYQFRKDLREAIDEDMLDFITAPQISANAFLNKYYNSAKYPLYDLPCTLDRVIRNYYFGGRVECRKIGYFETKPTQNQWIFMFDINSLYPAVMQQDLPYGKPEFFGKEAMIQAGMIHAKTNRLLYKCFGFVWCRLKNKEKMEDIPYLHAYHDGIRLMFPHFDQSTDVLIFSEEIKLSQKLKLPYEYEFIGVIQFQRHPFLKEFVDDFYAKKKQAGKDKQPAKKMIYKLFLNSLYGTFGIKKERKCISIYNEQQINEYMELWRSGSVINISRRKDYIMVEYLNIIETKACSVYVAASITALARMLQWEYQYDLIQTGQCEVLTGDTDSTAHLHHTGSLEEFKKSSFFEKYIVGGAEGIIGKSKDEMSDYVKVLSKEEKEDYLRQRNIDPEVFPYYPADRCIVGGCKMYVLESDYKDITLTKFALKGYKEKDTMTTEKFKKLFTEIGLENEQVQFKNEIMNQKSPFNIKISDVKKKFYAGYFKGDLKVLDSKGRIEEEEEEDPEPRKKKMKMDWNTTYKVEPFMVSKINNSKRPFPLENLCYYFDFNVEDFKEDEMETE